jgi:hypothetical protein
MTTPDQVPEFASSLASNLAILLVSRRVAVADEPLAVLARRANATAGDVLVAPVGRVFVVGCACHRDSLSW